MQKCFGGLKERKMLDLHGKEVQLSVVGACKLEKISLVRGSPPLGKILLIDVSYINGVINKGLNKNDLHIHADAKEDLLHHTSIRFLHQLLYSLVQTDINGCVCFSLQHLENNENHLPSAQEIHHPL